MSFCRYLTVIASLVLLGCASLFIGKVIPPSQYPSCDFILSTPSFLKLEHIEIDFINTNDSGEKLATMTVKGIVKITEETLKKLPTGHLYGMGLRYIIMDSNYAVVKAIAISVPNIQNLNIIDPIPFEKTFPYEAKAAFVTFNYNISHTF